MSQVVSCPLSLFHVVTQHPNKAQTRWPQVCTESLFHVVTQHPNKAQTKRPQVCTESLLHAVKRHPNKAQTKWPQVCTDASRVKVSTAGWCEGLKGHERQSWEGYDPRRFYTSGNLTPNLDLVHCASAHAGASAVLSRHSSLRSDVFDVQKQDP